MANTIYLEQLDGDKFEELCRTIFEKHYGCRVVRTPLVGDGGKDLIIHFHKGTIYAECKHQQSSVGRPIVQKLHSAMITDQIPFGIIITSSSFSPEALRYITDNHLPIELIDFLKLSKIASDVGFDLIIHGMNSGIDYCIPPVGYVSFNTNMVQHLKNQLISYPMDIAKIYKLNKKNAEMRSFFCVDYTVNSSITTTVGEIYSVHESGSFFIREKDGTIIKKDESFLFPKSAMVVYHPGDYMCNRENTSGMLNTQLMDISYANICSMYAKVVNYRGRNNQNYSKNCEPSKKDVFISNITHVYLPHSFVEYTLLNLKHSMHIIENNQGGFLDMDNHLGFCDVCGMENDFEKYLCNDCGKIYSVSNNHRCGQICSECGKTICIGCSFYYRKYLIFKKPVCAKCSTKFGNKKIKKYIN